MSNISKPVRQLAALALVAAASAALWFLAWLPLNAAMADQEDKIVQQREVLGRLLSIDGLEQEARLLGEKSKSMASQKLVLKGDSDPLRTSELQTALTAIVSAEGIRLKSSRGLPARDQNNVRLIGLQAQFHATLEQVQRIVIAIEASEPLLLIDALRIAAGPGAADPKNNAPLEVNIEVSGATGAAKG